LRESLAIAELILHTVSHSLKFFSKRERKKRENPKKKKRKNDEAKVSTDEVHT